MVLVAECVDIAYVRGEKLTRTITRADLVESIYSEVGISRYECADLVEQVLEEIATTLTEGKMVKLSSFGSFTIRDKKERMGRNPRTGKPATISPRRVLSFKASSVLKEQIKVGKRRRR